MQALLNTLDGMLKVLSDLRQVMEAEQSQLSAGAVNSSHLQQITEDKTALLATLDFFEQQRQQTTESSGLQIPYQQERALAQRWSSIQQHVKTLNDLNTHNGMLLNHQLAYTRDALHVLEPYHSKKFYGPDGQVGSGSFRPNKV